MAGTTPIYALPYPTGTDRVADGDNAMQALAEKVEADLIGARRFQQSLPQFLAGSGGGIVVGVTAASFLRWTNDGNRVQGACNVVIGGGAGPAGPWSVVCPAVAFLPAAATSAIIVGNGFIWNPGSASLCTVVINPGALNNVFRFYINGGAGEYSVAPAAGGNVSFTFAYERTGAK